MEDMDGLADEGLTWRLSQAAEARHRADTIRPEPTPANWAKTAPPCRTICKA